MYDIERKEKIMEILERRKSCSVTELAKMLSFSEATIRRDLSDLARDMRIHKTFGGAVIREGYSNEVPILVRRDENAEAKGRLCRAAAELIRDNMTVFLDASTTIEHIVPFLAPRRGLTVVTNHPDIPTKLRGANVVVYSTGGKFLHHSNSYVGEFARNMLRGINADLLLFSARGLSPDGRVTNSSTEDDIHRIMIENAAHTCLLIDSSKVGKVFPFTICKLSEVDTVITDKPLSDEISHGNVVLA